MKKYYSQVGEISKAEYDAGMKKLKEMMKKPNCRPKGKIINIEDLRQSTEKK